ncbi:TonB-dependent receptor [Microscilla marina]|uniref:Putative TonB-dependent outer membrane receptor protein n=1 Tax=Microscilla marina ATCC 23134 TaxID=313606 RepID=A1ZRF1_MICM2|nr:TonB-dependent receptor [Microscilla marina]EAY27041.1 putative TonB-dependent outer membrane receptor protein [Microscilla marina ATCC 23134]
MNIKKSIALFIMSLGTGLGLVQAQQGSIKGKVVEKAQGKEQALVGASVYWANTTTGVSTNAQGTFTLAKVSTTQQLVVSYTGYRNDTIEVANRNEIKVVLQTLNELETVVVKSEKDIDFNPIKSELITAKDLRKAACCNLSESFETNPSIDVTNTDAVTGTRRIRMLGLDGVYSQILVENMPSVRGLASRTGLKFIPGTWIKSIAINKGAGSVVNGYESVTGQINVTLAQPNNSEPLLVNLYGNGAGRVEANINTAHTLGKDSRWSTALLLHGHNTSQGVDRNNDGFFDIPQGNMMTVMNRWKYKGDVLRAQFGVKAVYVDKFTGQATFNQSQERTTALPYGIGFNTRRLEGFAKFGILPPNHPNQSLGIIVSGIHHEDNSFWGVNDFNAVQDNLSVNAIFQTQVNPQNRFSLGASYLFDRYDQNYEQQHPTSQTFVWNRTESVPGIFAEYTFEPNDQWALVTGVRNDFHNLYGNVFTPRMHLKYSMTPTSIIRVSGGRGFRVANIIPENFGYMISSRNLQVANDLQPEVAWNYGISWTQEVQLGKTKGKITADFYRTDFENQIVADLDASASAISFYNLEGRAFANSFQLGLEYEPFKRFDVSVAYKYYDVQSTTNNTLQQQPFIAQNRFFLNLAYATRFEKWSFDFTTQWFGAKRLPNTTGKPEAFRLAQNTPSFFLLNAQVTRNFRNWSLYVGSENLTNFRQDTPIIDPSNPFGSQFDAGLVWAPVLGRMVYAGLRFFIK